MRSRKDAKKLKHNENTYRGPLFTQVQEVSPNSENKHVRPDAVDKMAMALEALATQENAK